jgi:transcriptional regulator with XRE-family HTH domain
MKQAGSKQALNNLSDAIKEWRNSAGLTQRQVAQQIGVKPSYVAYLEAGERQPSLALAMRLAELMKADPVKICCAAHPELEEILSTKPKPAGSQTDTWKRFTTEAALLKRHHVTDEELRVLKEVNRMAKIKNPRNLLFVLNSIRQAIAAD